MTATRRRVLRTAPPTPPLTARQRQRLARDREQLDKERAALARWMTRLKRAFNAMQKHQARIGRIERRLNQTQA